MNGQAVVSSDSFLQRHSVLAYFLMTFAISWAGALAVAAPDLLRGQAVSRLSGILMFPAMLLGPSISGIVMTRVVSGKDGVKDLFARMGRGRVPVRWYGVLLIPPALVFAVLFSLKALLSPSFAPNHFWFGVLFGVPAGFLEEIGWTGFAFPHMSSKGKALGSAIVLGMIWGTWHLPAINFLGAAAPHGAYWIPFFLAFAFAMTAMRVIISWLYLNTKSVLLAQLMHVSSTGTLVIFSPRVSPAQEVMWYAVYGCVLWAVVGVIAAKTCSLERFRENALPVSR
jgi:membrane protease YdiL (CAAX protease family)